MDQRADRRGNHKQRFRFFQQHVEHLGNKRLASALENNIKGLEDVRREARAARGIGEKVVDAVTNAAGSMGFFYFHVAWFSIWIVWNMGAFGLKPFDPFPFGLLTMIVSLEAIMLSTIVIVSQNRAAKLAEDRADLDLQINLLNELEVTRLLRISDAIAAKLGVEVPDDLDELKEDVEPQDVLRRIEGERQKDQSP